MGPIAKTTSTGPLDNQDGITQFISRKQLAKRWGVCEHTIARNQKLTVYRFNSRLLRYRIVDVQAYEDEYLKAN